jgi:hypothetical protein
MDQRTAAQRKQVREDDNLRTGTNALANFGEEGRAYLRSKFQIWWTLDGYPLRRRHEARWRKHRRRDIV